LVAGARAEDDVLADGVGARADVVRGRRGGVVVVQTDAAEVLPEARFHARAERRIKWMARRTQHLVHRRRRALLRAVVARPAATALPLHHGLRAHGFFPPPHVVGSTLLQGFGISPFFFALTALPRSQQGVVNAAES